VVSEAIRSAVFDALSQTLSDVERLEDKQGVSRFAGNLTLRERMVRIQVLLEPDFPLRLPHICLDPADALGDLPHVDPHGLICFLDPEGTVLDESRPGDIVRDAISRAARLLEDGVQGTNRDEFTNEFEASWAYLPTSGMYVLLSAPGPDARTFDILERDGGGVVARSKTIIEQFTGTTPNNDDFNHRFVQGGALYLPLQEGSFIHPPHPGRPFWTAADLRQNLIAQLSDSHREKVERILGKDKRPIRHLIVSLPRPKGGDSLFGIRLDGLSAPHTLLPGGDVAGASPVPVVRANRAFLAGRGGAQLALLDKRVLIVGCGSLGSRIALELAKSGIGAVSLVDPDRFSPDNTFRHVLGRESWGKDKSEALASYLRSNLFQITVRSIPKSIVDALADHSIRFADYDLVVFATGNPTLELRMNQLLSELELPPPALFTWVEPLGIGGHALVVQSTSAGCLRCLYEEPYDECVGLYNGASFAGPGQSFGRALSGCGTTFTPFGSLDAGTTATMATRLAMSVLLGRERRNPLVSWKGDASDFTHEGFRLSDRFGMSEQFLRDNRYAYRSPNCPICGRRSFDEGT